MKVNALELRNHLGAVLDRLDREGEPIIVEKGRQPRAVLLPLSLYRERFLDFQQRELREALLAEIRNSASEPQRSSLAVLRELRYGGVPRGDPQP